MLESMHVKKVAGFSLIELMIVIVIIGTLAAVALPSYKNSMMKTRRGDAKEALTNAAAAMERYFFTHNQYTSTLSAIGSSTTSSEGHYTLGVYTHPTYDDSDATTALTCATGGNSYPCYIMTAVANVSGAQSGDTECKLYYITHTGKKGASSTSTIADALQAANDTSDDCW